MSSSENTPVKPASSSGEADGAKKRFRRRNRRPNNNQPRENSTEGKLEGQTVKRPNRPTNSRRLEVPAKEKEASSSPRNNGDNNNGTSRNTRNPNKGNTSSAGHRRPNEASRGSESNNRRRNNGNNDKNKNRRNTSKRAEIPPFERRKIDLEMTCSICGKVITDLFSAIVASDGEQAGVCHFDCAVENIKSRETLGEEESVVYIGAGNFAIAKLKREGRGKTNFEIIRKIEFEPKKDELAPIEWRKALQQK